MINLPFYIFRKYLIHQFQAKGKHSLHSPFMYQFYNECVLKRVLLFEYFEIENTRNQLKKDDKILVYNDLGAGSRNQNTSKRVKHLAQNSLNTKPKAQFLAAFAVFINAQNIVELGTSLGITTSYLSKACPKANITTVEGIAAIANLAQQTFKNLNCLNINLVNLEFDAFLKQQNNNINKPDLVYIDGNHTYQNTLDYFEKFRNQLSSKGFIIFDDIYWSKEMTKAWEEIQNHDAVTISIDLFYFGIITFNKAFSKQHFKLHF